MLAIAMAWKTARAQGLDLAKGDSIRVEEVLTTRSSLQLQLPPAADPQGDGKINREDRSRLLSRRRIAIVNADQQGKPTTIRVVYEQVPPSDLAPVSGEQVVDLSTPLAGRVYLVDCQTSAVSRTDGVSISPDETTGLKVECVNLARLRTPRATLGTTPTQSTKVVRDAALADVLPNGFECMGLQELRLTLVNNSASSMSYNVEADAQQQGLASNTAHLKYVGTVRTDSDGSVRWALSYNGPITIPLASGSGTATGATASEVAVIQRVTKFRAPPT
jgi:hypothetical protein